MLINWIRNFLIQQSKKFGYYYPERLQYKKLRRIFYLQELYSKIEKIDGDIVECGVAYGESLIIFSALAKQEGRGRKVYGFDSFEGFPDPSDADNSPRKPKRGEYSDANMKLVKRMIKKASVPEPVLVKGYVEDTASSYAGTIALLHIDLDLYEGYKAVLDNLFDKVAKGGIVAFDDYGDPNWPGATRAVTEFIEGRYQIQKAKFVEKYYIVKS